MDWKDDGLKDMAGGGFSGAEKLENVIRRQRSVGLWLC